MTTMCRWFRLGDHHIPLGAVLLAGLLAMRKIVVLLHLAAVPHVVCAEHGEVLHDSQLEAEAAAVRATRRNSEVVPGYSISEAHSHEECAFCQSSRKRLGLGLITVSRAVLVATSQAPFYLDHTDPSEGILLHLLAPKQSPPT